MRIHKVKQLSKICQYLDNIKGSYDKSIQGYWVNYNCNEICAGIDISLSTWKRYLPHLIKAGILKPSPGMNKKKDKHDRFIFFPSAWIPEAVYSINPKVTSHEKEMLEILIREVRKYKRYKYARILWVGYLANVLSWDEDTVSKYLHKALELGIFPNTEKPRRTSRNV